ncbi:MAG: energy transducer TonB [Terriglobales bacterium]
MFADYISVNSWANRSHRGWTTLVSFAAQALAMAGLLVVPLFYIQAMPRLALLGSVIAPLPPPQPGSARTGQSRVVSTVAGHVLLPPAPIPIAFRPLGDGDATVSEFPAGPGVAGATGDHTGGNSVLDAIGPAPNSLMPLAPSVRPPRVSLVMEGNLIRRVQPEYPALAKQARIQGAVVLRAVIDREGTIQNLQVISGHPLLVQAAINAVRQWRYRPYYLNQQPVEVETQVTVNFTLPGG